MMIIKPLGEELPVTAADDIDGAKLVRIYAASISKVTIENPGANTVIGSFTVPAGSTTIVEKNKEDTIAGTTALLCTPVSYKS
jgi:hypothetical protein